MTPTHDFLVEDQGTIILFTPMNEVAEKWVDENLDVADWQWLGASFGVDRRIGIGLAERIEDAGLTYLLS